jgi:hypothetical protein
MFTSRATSILLLIFAIGFIFVGLSSATTTRPANSGITGFEVRASPTPTPIEPARPPEPNATPQPVAKTVQIFLTLDADILIENSDGKRIGLDFKTLKFVSEIPEARVISRETSSTYVLPFDKSGQPYIVTVSGKSAAKEDADLSMTGPGFVVGFRGLTLKAGQTQKLSIASNGLRLSLTANQNGPAPQIFLTTQSGRDRPSYRFEVVSSLLEIGKTITVDLDLLKGRLYFKSDAVNKDSFSVKMRRTNPGGTRDMFAHQSISFGKTNSYAMDFGQWDGQVEMCFYEMCDGCKDKPCTNLKNESEAKVIGAVR